MSSYIAGWGVATPSAVVTNADLARRLDTSDEWIVERTGIRERRIAIDGESTATLGADAARAAIDRAGLSPADVDLLIVATSTPETLMPHTGAYIGEELGLECGSFDLNSACTGFVTALIVGHAMVNAGHHNVVVVGAETMSRVADPDDRSTYILFGDGAGALVLRRSPDAGCLLGWDLGGDGSATDILIIPAGGSRQPTTARTVADRGHFMKMQGGEVFKRAVRAVVDSAHLALRNAERTISDVRWFVPHQANLRIIEAAAQRLEIPMDRVVTNIASFGNTSTASIPLALAAAADRGDLHAGDIMLLSGFGAGMSWASAVARWGGPR